MLWKNYLKYLPLPLLAAAYPILFLYGHNASALELSSLQFPLAASLLTAGLSYMVFCFFQRKPLAASLSAAVFVILYYLYGPVYHLFVDLKIFPINHTVLLPLVLALAAAAAYCLFLIKPRTALRVHKVLLVVSTALVVYNVLGVTVPVEAQKILSNRPWTDIVSSPTNTAQVKPDIYYIVLDEYSGFDAVRSYWHADHVDAFEKFLIQNHFFVAAGSRSATLNTGSEIASRLNLQPYPEKLPNLVKVQAIDNNKVMRLLKSYGYTTVAIDMAFHGIKADLNVEYDPEEVGGMAADEFQKTFVDITMFSAFSSYMESGSQAAINQRDMILYSLNKTASIGDLPSPKFVYTHVLLPHEPFIFDQNGNLLPPEAAYDWNYYLGQHKYATKLAEQLVRKLLVNADPHNPPVIIVQSDHGARNNVPLTDDPGHKLKNYPSEKMYQILNALYLPGFDTSQLPATLDPMETFTLVLNHYLNAEVKVNRTPAN